MQVAAAQPLRQGLHGNATRSCRDGVSLHGAFSTGSVGPSSCTTGVPTSDATCIGPLSEPMKRRLAANSNARSASVGVAGASRAAPCDAATTASASARSACAGPALTTLRTPSSRASVRATRA